MPSITVADVAKTPGRPAMRLTDASLDAFGEMSHSIPSSTVPRSLFHNIALAFQNASNVLCQNVEEQDYTTLEAF